MYAQPAFNGLTQPVINPQQIAQNFQFTVQTPDQELSGLTPTVAIAAANIFVQSLEKNHPVRVAAYNQVASNQFVNNEFRGFINYCIRAAMVAFESNQTNSIRDVCQRFLPEWINMYSAAVAIVQPMVMQQLDQGTQQSVAQLAQKYTFWVKETEMKSNAVAQQMMARNGQQGNFNFAGQQQTPYGTNFGGNPMMGQQPNMTGASGFAVAATNMMGQTDTSGVHVSNSGYYQRKLQEDNANRAQDPAFSAPHALSADIKVESNTSVMDNHKYVSPYAKKLKAEMDAAGIVESTGKGSRWGTLEDNAKPAATSVVPPTAPSAPAATLPTTQQAIVQKNQQSAATKDFDESIMDFDKNPAPVLATVPTPETHLEKKAIISTTTMNGCELRVVSILMNQTVESAGWKPSKYQHYFPAWCRRTHELIYAVADTGEVVAVPTPFKPEEALKMFDYEAHGINPNMGQPAREVQTPPREEAQVLYSKDPENVKIKVQVARKTASASSELHQMALMESLPQFTKDKTLQLNVIPGITYDYLGYTSEEEAKAAFDQLREVRMKITYASSAAAISAITSPVLRKKIDKLFTDRFNELLRDRLGIDGYIDSYIEEAASASDMIREEMGDLIADALIMNQSAFIDETLDVVIAEEVPEFSESICPSEEKEDLDAFMKNNLFITANHAVLTSRFTGDELAIGVGENASQLDAECYPVLHKAISDALSNPEIKDIRYTSIILQSVDGAKFKILRSAINDDIILIKAL